MTLKGPGEFGGAASSGDQAASRNVIPASSASSGIEALRHEAVQRALELSGQADNAAELLRSDGSDSPTAAVNEAHETRVPHTPSTRPPGASTPDIRNSGGPTPPQPFNMPIAREAASTSESAADTQRNAPVAPDPDTEASGRLLLPLTTHWAKPPVPRQDMNPSGGEDAISAVTVSDGLVAMAPDNDSPGRDRDVRASPAALANQANQAEGTPPTPQAGDRGGRGGDDNSPPVIGAAGESDDEDRERSVEGEASPDILSGGDKSREPSTPGASPPEVIAGVTAVSPEEDQPEEPVVAGDSAPGKRAKPEGSGAQRAYGEAMVFGLVPPDSLQRTSIVEIAGDYEAYADLLHRIRAPEEGLPTEREAVLIERGMSFLPAELRDRLMMTPSEYDAGVRVSGDRQELAAVRLLAHRANTEFLMLVSVLDGDTVDYRRLADIYTAARSPLFLADLLGIEVPSPRLLTGHSGAEVPSTIRLDVLRPVIVEELRAYARRAIITREGAQALRYRYGLDDGQPRTSREIAAILSVDGLVVDRLVITRREKRATAALVRERMKTGDR